MNVSPSLTIYPFLAAFRRRFGCQTTLLRLVEDWKLALDQHKCVAAILMDLSKTFDCLPHRLLLAKLEAYGLSGGGGGGVPWQLPRRYTTAHKAGTTY